MTASAGAATVAYEGLAATRGEPAGAQAAIITCREPGARQMLHRELSKRYGGDYQIVVCGQPGQLAPWIRDLRAAGLAVAMVIGEVGAQNPDGIEVLASVRAIDPTALRVAAVRWGDWQSVRAIFDAVTLGTVGRAVIVLRTASVDVRRHYSPGWIAGAALPGQPAVVLARRQ